MPEPEGGMPPMPQQGGQMPPQQAMQILQQLGITPQNLPMVAQAIQAVMTMQGGGGPPAGPAPNGPPPPAGPMRGPGGMGMGQMG